MSVFTLPAFPKLASNVLTTMRGLMPRCANPACKSVSVLHGFIARSHNGAILDGNWYCSPDCFEEAIKTHVRTLILGAKPKAQRHRSRIPLGLTLLERGQISSEQLKSALSVHRGSGRRIGDIFMEKGFATEEQITAAVASQWGVPVFDLGARFVDVQVRIPYPLLEIYSLLPVHFGEKANKLLVGFVNGVEHRILSAIERVTGIATAPCFITATDYLQHLHNVAAEQQHEEAIFDKPASIAEMARIVRNYAVQTGADEARFGYCRDYVWARLQGARRQIDLLFRVPVG